MRQLDVRQVWSTPGRARDASLAEYNVRADFAAEGQYINKLREQVRDRVCAAQEYIS